MHGNAVHRFGGGTGDQQGRRGEYQYRDESRGICEYGPERIEDHGKMSFISPVFYRESAFSYIKSLCQSGNACKSPLLGDIGWAAPMWPQFSNTSRGQTSYPPDQTPENDKKGQ
jgi:hypothetical protein